MFNADMIVYNLDRRVYKVHKTYKLQLTEILFTLIIAIRLGCVRPISFQRV